MWQPSASLNNLHVRAKILAHIREFFAARNVLEVETPLLCSSTATDPHISSFFVNKPQRYLQTSPEFCMKRLLAAGSGAIYQIAKAFRDDEIGKKHNPEFSLLEWYRPGFDHHALMNEVDELLQLILKTPSAKKITYAAIFQQYLAINPHLATIIELQNCAAKQHLKIDADAVIDRDQWLNLLLTHSIEPHLITPTCIYDFPASQAALAKIRQEGAIKVAERFEFFVNAMELANGYHELADANEQQQRFLQDNQLRQQLHYPEVPIDHYLIAALENFPSCAGVALGVDRLVMLFLQANSINEVISFNWDRV